MKTTRKPTLRYIASHEIPAFFILKLQTKNDLCQQEPEKPEEEKKDAAQQDEAPHRPKWKPPGQLG